MTNIDPLAPPRRLLSAVHGLRGLAAIAVVLFHLHHLNQLPLPVQLSFIGTHFGLGVQLFFVLNAFSLYYSTQPHIGNHGWVSTYFIKRYFRIAPLFYVMLITWLIFFHLRGVKFVLGDILLYATFLFNFVPGQHETIVAAAWTIGVEMIFYALLPILLLTITRLRHAITSFLVAVAIGLIFSSAMDRAGGTLKDYAPKAFMASIGVFSAGILSYWWYRALVRLDGQSHATLKTQLQAIAPILTILTLIINPIIFERYLNERYNQTIVWSLLFCSIVSWQAKYPSQPLRSKAMEFLGEHSFSIYLLHPLIIHFLTPINKKIYAEASSIFGPWAFIANACLTLAVVIASAALTYRLIENPGVRIGQRLISITKQQSNNSA